MFFYLLCWGNIHLNSQKYMSLSLLLFNRPLSFLRTVIFLILRVRCRIKIFKLFQIFEHLLSILIVILSNGALVNFLFNAFLLLPLFPHPLDNFIKAWWSNFSRFFWDCLQIEVCYKPTSLFRSLFLRIVGTSGFTSLPIFFSTLASSLWRLHASLSILFSFKGLEPF